MDDNMNMNTNEEFLIEEENEEFFPSREQEKRPSLTKEVFEWLDVITTAVIAVVVLFSLIFRVATISGRSMFPTLSPNDKVVISHFAYTPKYGDIVVISRNADNSVDQVKAGQVPIIKRVIAVGGQTVDIDSEKGVVLVDGKELDESSYLNVETIAKDDRVKFPLYVPEGYIFVLGDNRNESLDSRYSQIGENGLIDTRYVLGRAVVRIFPFQSIGIFKEP